MLDPEGGKADLQPKTFVQVAALKLSMHHLRRDPRNVVSIPVPT